MRVLQLCSKPPYPPDDGGRIAMKNAAQGLMDEGVEVKVLCISTPKHPFDAAVFPQPFKGKTRIESSFVDTSLKILPALGCLCRGVPYNVQRFNRPCVADMLRNALEASPYDVIQFEGIFTAPYLDGIKDEFPVKTVLRAHNAEAELLKQRALGEKNILKKSYMLAMSRQLDKYERRTIAMVDAVAAISEADKEHFCLDNPDAPVEAIPAGIDVPAYQNKSASFGGQPGMSVFHIGALDWEPNIRGLRWFIKEVWPALLDQFPEMEFHIAGRNPNKDFKPEGKNIVLHGAVDDALLFMLQNSIMVVPLWEGSGLRIKIVEAMALGRPVVTTSTGLRGIHAENQRHLLVADSGQAFVSAISRLLSDSGLAEGLTARALDLAVREYDIKAAAQQFITLYHKILAA